MLKIEQKTFKQMPDILFWERKKGSEYIMFDMVKRKNTGYVMVTPRKDELFLNSLIINKSCRRKGYGVKLLNFVKNLSKRMGFEGRMRCFASLTEEDSKNPPHIFYRKYGFTSDNKDVLKIIDDAIKENKPLDDKMPMEYMYYTG